MEPQRPAELLDWIDTQGARSVLQAYCQELQAAGARTNLIGTLETERIWDELLLDAAVSYRLLPLDVHTLVDIGSGAGLPGLVWALLARSQGRVLALTLLEPRAKRVAFLQEAVELMGLGQTVTCLKATLGGYRERVGRTFDLVTSRAVFPLAEVVEQQAVLAGRYQLVHASVADLERWQAPGGWHIAAQQTYQPGAAAERGYILLQRV